METYRPRQSTRISVGMPKLFAQSANAFAPFAAAWRNSSGGASEIPRLRRRMESIKAIRTMVQTTNPKQNSQRTTRETEDKRCQANASASIIGNPHFAQFGGGAGSF